MIVGILVEDTSHAQRALVGGLEPIASLLLNLLDKV